MVRVALGTLSDHLIRQNLKAKTKPTEPDKPKDNNTGTTPKPSDTEEAKEVKTILKM